jgi:hypothetical protein
LDDYDPFNGQNRNNSVKNGGGPITSAPAVMNPTMEQPPPPPYNPSSQQQISAADFEVNFIVSFLIVMYFYTVWAHHAEALVDPKVLAKNLILDTPEHVDSENIKF